MKTLFLLGMMVVGAGAQTAKPAKPANTAPPDSSGIFTASAVVAPIIATVSTSSMQVYGDDGVLIAKCDAAGEFQHEFVSNCVISEGHTLTEVMQAWLKSVHGDNEWREAERAAYQQRYDALWQSYHDFLEKLSKDLEPPQHKSSVPKGAKP